MNSKISLTILALGSVSQATGLFAAEKMSRPNIAWYITEDTSPQYLALYNNGLGAQMPNLEKFAKEATTFTNAFSNAPVSSAARTTLLTSCYAPRCGGALHRFIERFPLPEGVEMFPKLLSANGYFTTNAKKDDYNVTFDSEDVWMKPKANYGDWRARKDKNQPFFYMSTNMVSHEGRLLFPEKTYKTQKTKFDPAKVNISKAFPDTDLWRYTYATFYDKLAESDAEFGRMLDKLREDDLMDNTIIFFFGDNGGTTPGTKGYTTNYGLRVPLLVYVPEQWREELGVKAGETCTDIVSFMDFGATVLKLAGVEAPKNINGVPFLGKDCKKNESVVCYGDRFDELYAFSRVLYRGKYRYARNYTPYHSQGIHTFYRYKSLAFQEWRELFRAGKLSGKQASFYEPQGAEELYDVQNDPEEFKNLASDPQYGKVLKAMRKELDGTITKRLDLGFYPEAILLEDAIKDPEQFGKDHSKDISKYCKVANQQLLPYSKAQKNLLKSLTSTDVVEQWWALTNVAWFAKEVGNEEISIAKEQLNGGGRALIKSRAAVALLNAGEKVAADKLLKIISSSKSLAESILVLNDMAYLYESKLIKPLALTLENTPFSNDTMVKERVIYLSKPL